MEEYPLTWPNDYPRSQQKLRSRFNHQTLSTARDILILEIKRLGGPEWALSTNVALKRDGLPYGNYEKSKISDCGVAVYFKLKGNNTVLCCDRWNSVEDNIWAIAKSIDALRSLDRWGVSDMLNRVFTGFTALPQSTENWWTVFNCDRYISTENIKTIYRKLVIEYHPDKGGDVNKYIRIQNAIAAFEKERGV